MTPCRGSTDATSTNGSPGTHATYTESLKKMVRGFDGLMICACKLVFENTAICDSTGTFSARSTAVRYPDRASNRSVDLPLSNSAFAFATASDSARVRYPIAS